MEIYNLQSCSQEELRKLQMKSLEVLVYFRDFCRENNLLFHLCGGTCLGAVRHKGFIPWDDDIDVFMLRDDYEKLEKLWNEKADTDKYAFCRTTKDKNYHHIVSSIRDKTTTFINSHSVDEDIEHGVGIDILPLDGYAESKFKRFKQVFFAMVFSLFNAQRLPDNQGKTARFLSKIILGLVKSPKLRYKLWSYSEKQMVQCSIEESDYIAQLLSGFKFMKLKYPKEIFTSTIDMDFEGEPMPLPKGYDEYLRMGFGDYMSYPPKEDQIPKHKTVYINLDRGYEEYRGIHYLRNNN